MPPNFKSNGKSEDISVNSASKFALSDSLNKEHKKTNGTKKSDFEQRIEKLVAKGRRRGKRFSIIGITGSIIICLVVLISGYYIYKEVGSLSANVNSGTHLLLPADNNGRDINLPVKWRSCENSSDCQETQKSCCACNSGGEQTGINNKFINSWRDRLGKSCSQISCVALMNCQAGRVVCQNNLCDFEKNASSTN